MTVRVERSFELPVERERVWEFIADPGRRATAISVVEDYTVHDDGSATWHIRLPIPVVDKTIAVETEDEEVREPEYVRFVGRSKVMKVVGEHELAETETGTKVTNRFVVDGSLPGVERFFKKNLDGELKNLEEALAEDLGVEV
ncbi:CoxG family protein [Halosimplex salinum]|uniref:CoxG family protein n=1 Tax=Halosimplex salinum TaxID=1710538 RepID=UPI000F4938F1|nr:SRPBCC family protein [Halosimplex salinum]